jgi:cation diffusion facilitator CzcD-associated flavoprotein CzcO
MPKGIEFLKIWFTLDYPDFVPHEKTKEYFEAYCDNFGLKKYIKFHHSVVGLVQSATGTWTLSTKSAAGIVEWEFDKVLLATGRHQTPIWPKIEGYENFQGSLTHVATCFPLFSG